MSSLERLFIHTGITILAVVLCMCGSAYLARVGGPVVLVVFMAGTVGGTANNFRRIQNIALRTGGVTDLPNERLLMIQIYVSPLVGGVFAVILYLVFMAGILQGTFFPAFKCGSEPYETFREFAALAEPATHVDVAKAIVWAVIAGFSERLVPNFIDRVAREATTAVMSTGAE
jgi:hypothetical protein